MSNLRPWCLFLLLLSSFGRPCCAEDTSGNLRKLSLEQLGNLEVTTVSKEPVKLFQAPAAIFVLTQEDIRRSGATSIPEALRLVPGVNVARLDSNKWSLGIRGFGSRLSQSVLVLIDGRSVYTPLFAGVYWEVQDTLLQDIDRIEVIRGPGGTIWGANAVNGVINIITKNARDTHGLLVSAGGGSVDQGSLDFRYGGGNGKEFNYRIYGKGFTRGPEYHQNKHNNDDWRMAQTGFRADWELRGRDTFTLQGDLYKSEDGESVPLVDYAAPFVKVVEQNAELSGGNLLGRWKRALRGGSDLQVTAYYDRTNRREANFSEDRDTFDVDLVHRLPSWKRQTVLWGLGARFSNGRSAAPGPSVEFFPDQKTDKLYSIFVQDEIAIVRNRLSLTLGSKFLHNEYTGFEFEPSSRLMWTPSSRQTLWAAMTRAVRTPSRVEEDLQILSYLTTVGGGTGAFLRLAGNKGFNSERLVGYELGYRTLLGPNLQIFLAAFFNDYDRLLSTEVRGNPFVEAKPAPQHIILPLAFRNGLMGASTGMEIAPEWRPLRWWRLNGSYSFLHIDLKSRPGSLDRTTAGSTENSSPQHQVVAASSLDLPGRIEFSQVFRFVSALPAQRVNHYGTADVRLAWRATPQFELSIVGQNLLQPHHPEFAGPGTGIRRGVQTRVTWRSPE